MEFFKGHDKSMGAFAGTVSRNIILQKQQLYVSFAQGFRVECGSDHPVHFFLLNAVNDPGVGILDVQREVGTMSLEFSAQLLPEHEVDFMHDPYDVAAL